MPLPIVAETLCRGVAWEAFPGHPEGCGYTRAPLLSNPGVLRGDNVGVQHRGSTGITTLRISARAAERPQLPGGAGRGSNGPVAGAGTGVEVKFGVMAQGSQLEVTAHLPEPGAVAGWDSIAAARKGGNSSLGRHQPRAGGIHPAQAPLRAGSPSVPKPVRTRCPKP